MADLLQELRTALDEASRTPRGRRAVTGHNEDFELDISGHGTVHVAIAGGRLTVQPGPSPRREPLRFTRVELDEGTLRAILGGAISPVEAMEQGKLFLRTRLYGGGLITILLRAAYDLARERALASALSAGTAASSSRVEGPGSPTVD
jgi:hypothetical protein